MVLNLYLNLLSPSCRSLYIFAKLHFISFEMIPVDLLKAEHHSEAFAQLNPLMKVPVMKDEDFILGESVAIMLYLCQRFKTPDHWYPAEAQSRALVDEYLAWQHLNIKKHCTKILWMKMVIPHFFQYAVPELKLKESMAELSHSLDLLKKKFLKDKPFLTGDRISLADVMALEDLVQESEDMDIIRQLQHTDKVERRQLLRERSQQQRGMEGLLPRAISADYNVFENRPWLKVWQKKVQSILGQQLCEEAHGPILKLKDAPPLSSDMLRKFDVKKSKLLIC